VRAGKLARVEAGGRSFVVFAIGEDLYALDDRCSHQNESLSEVGAVDDGELECCAHGARFDPATGTATGLPATAPLATAEVRVRDGRVEVGVVANGQHPVDWGRRTDRQPQRSFA
jgi:nitrite reductase/ring-hydroxylating ferredoxin subunit